MRLSLLLTIVLSVSARAAAPSITITQNASSVGRYDVYELTMVHSATYANPWVDVSITCVFTAPSGQQSSVDGFYYDTNTWKCRFAPRETGTYSWTLSFSNGSGTATSSGSFTSTTSSRSGFVKRHPTNSYALITEANNKLFFGIGAPQMHYADYGTLPIVAGVDHSANDGLVDFEVSPSDAPFPCYDWNGSSAGNCTYTPVSADTYFSTYASEAGANLFRSNGEALPAHELNELNGGTAGLGKFNTRLDYGKQLDQVVQAAHKYDVHVIWDPIYNASAYGAPSWDLSDANLRGAFLGYWRYVVARYGAYVDIWELGNEADVSDSFITIVAGDIVARDPYGHLITAGGGSSSGFRGSTNSRISVNGPHFYFNVATLDLDNQYINGPYGISNIKTSFPNKPFFWGELGDACPYGQMDDQTRIRTYAWVGLLTQVAAIVPWNNGQYGACTGTYVANFYFGPKPRAYAKVVSALAQTLDPAAVPIGMTVSPNVRGYGLASGSDLAAYFLHTNSRTTALSGATVTLTVPGSGMTGQWIDPATGNVMATFNPAQGSQTLTIPAFTADIALRIQGAGGPPPVSRCDLNSDGQVTNADVQNALDQALGRVPCGSADLDGNGRCDVVDVQRVTNAALGGACRVGP